MGTLQFTPRNSFYNCCEEEEGNENHAIGITYELMCRLYGSKFCIAEGGWEFEASKITTSPLDSICTSAGKLEVLEYIGVFLAK